jgi:hypothetical protein
MKKNLNRTMAALGAALGLAASTGAAQSTYEWQFGSASNPAAAGGAQASIALGQFSMSWNAGSVVFGPCQGIWDLGQSGSITIRTPDAAPPDGDTRVITVKVVQYEDGMIYDQLAAVTVPGATLIASKLTEFATAKLGQWTESETQWSVNTGLAADTVVIAGSEYGSLVDSVTVASSGAGDVNRPALRIRHVGSQLVISWPAGDDQMVLEANSDLSNPQGWAPVTEPVVVKDGVRSVSMDAAGASLFYRLKQ